MDGAENTYLEKFRKERRSSFWSTIPNTQVEWFPRSGNEGLYGYTYRGSGKIAMREDLQSNLEEKVDTDMHESSHTPDEYETRIKTKARMKILFPDGKAYSGGEVPSYII